MPVDHAEAAAALASMRETRHRFESGFQCGWGYSIAFGAAMGWLCAIQAAPFAWRGGGYLVFAIAVAAMTRYKRRTTGRFVNGYRKGRTRWVAFGLVAIFAPLILLASWLSSTHRAPWAPVYAGTVMAVVAAFANRLWMRAYRADIEDAR